jgi:hypothetical protein
LVLRRQQQQGWWVSNSNEQWWWQQLWWAKMRMVVMAMRVAGNKEGEGGMAMAMVQKIAGKQW